MNMKKDITPPFQQVTPWTNFITILNQFLDHLEFVIYEKTIS